MGISACFPRYRSAWPGGLAAMDGGNRSVKAMDGLAGNKQRSPSLLFPKTKSDRLFFETKTRNFFHHHRLLHGGWLAIALGVERGVFFVDHFFGARKQLI